MERAEIDVGFRPVLVLPGDAAEVRAANGGVKLGPGLRAHSGVCRASVAGMLRYRAPASYHVEAPHRTAYTPRAGESGTDLHHVLFSSHMQAIRLLESSRIRVEIFTVSTFPAARPLCSDALASMALPSATSLS
jgi:hypothetical protein